MSWEVPVLLVIDTALLVLLIRRVFGVGATPRDDETAPYGDATTWMRRP